MSALFSSLWAKLAALAALVAGAVLFLARIFKAGGDAARARASEAALAHERETSQQVRRSDDAVSDIASERARRVRKLFQRDD